MSGGAKSAPGVRYVRTSMNVRDLNGCAKNQKQSTAKSKDDPPGVSRVLFCLRTGHHSNYNVRLVPRLVSGVRAIKTVT
jgi:hypothetical protein